MKTYILAIALLAPLMQAVAQSPSPKPPVGVPLDARLFNGKWYRVYLEKGSWKNARAKCTRLGGRLALVPDERTQAFMRPLANGIYLWLGATDEKVEGRWIWEGGMQMEYKAWDRGQPSNHRAREHWLALCPNGSWADLEHDSDLVVGFVCEWDAR